MLPKYNQELWVAIEATVTADAVKTATSSLSCHYKWGSTSAMPASTFTGAGGHLAYLAYDAPTGIIKMLYAGDS